MALAYLFLSVAGLVSIGTFFIQVRGLPAMIGGFRTSHRFVQARLLQHLSLGSILAAPLALAVAGPGAIAWLWVGTFAAMGLIYAETRLARRLARDDGSVPTPLGYLRRLPGRIGQGLTLAYVCTALLFWLIAGVALPTQQGLAAWQTRLVSVDPQHAGLLSVVLLTAWLARRRVLALLTPIIGLGVTLYVAAMVWLLVSDISACKNAWQTILDDAGHTVQSGAPASLFFAVAFHGLSKAIWASEAGLGAGGFELEPAARMPMRSVQTMWVPLLLTGVLGTVSALAVLAYGPAWRETIDDLSLRQSEDVGDGAHEEDKAASHAMPLDKKVPWMVPLERRHARFFNPSEVGQTIVLPTDTPLQAGQSYPMLMRANPRGRKMGDLTPKGNGLAVGRGWDIFAQVKLLLYRAKERHLADNTGFDLRVPVEVLPFDQNLIPSGYIYRPIDPRFNLHQLAKILDGPYVVTGDVVFNGTVLKMQSERDDVGTHLAMVEHLDDSQAQRAPTLLELIRDLGYRGPYFATQSERPPTAMVGDAGLQWPIGAKIPLRLHSPPRGLDIALTNEVDGSVEIPAWTFLQATQTLILRHVDDPALDLHIRVKAIKSPSGRLRLYSDDPAFPELRLALRKRGPTFKGPYVAAPAFDFAVEVHTGLNLPDPPDTPSNERGLLRGPLALRQSLVFVHEDPEPIGGKGQLYAPHPGEVIKAGMLGPTRTNEGISQVMRLFESRFGGGGLWTGLAFVTLLALFGALQALRKGAALCESYFGRGAGYGFVLIGVLATSVAGQHQLDVWAHAVDGLVGLVFAINGLALCLFLPELIRRPKKQASANPT